MLNFITIVVAIIVANIVMYGLMAAVVFNKRIMKWWTKKYVKLITEISEDMVKDELSED